VLSFKAGGAELEEFVTDIPISEHPMPREPSTQKFQNLFKII